LILVVKYRGLADLESFLSDTEFSSFVERWVLLLVNHRGLCTFCIKFVSFPAFAQSTE
jgi:hypothetical protein